MPVIPQVSEGLLMGLNTTPSAPAEMVGAIKTSAQSTMASAGVMPLGPILIPVLPIGAAVGIILSKLEGLMFKGFEDAAKIAQRMLDQYNTDSEKAKTQRESATDELYEDEKESQANIKEEIIVLEEEIAKLDEEIAALKVVLTAEITAYRAVIFEYKENAKKAEEAGDTEGSEMWLDKVEDQNVWIEQIEALTIVVVEKNISRYSKNRDLENKKELAALTIKKEWEWLEEHATDFEVPVPYYPDLPTAPNLPPAVPIPKENPMSQFGRQAFAKWVVTPMIPALGIGVATIQKVIQSKSPSLPAASAAKLEASADSIMVKMGGVI